jgi:hypothetical protein
MSSSRQRGPCVGEREHVGLAGRLQRHRAARQVQHAAHHLAARQRGEQLGQAGGRGHRLEHQLQRAAAGQAEALRLLGADAVLHHLGRVERERAVAHLGDEVVLDAAAGDRAGDAAVVAHRHRRAHRARRRAPGAGDGAEHRAVAGLVPVLHLLQHAQVNVVHGFAWAGARGAAEGRT